MILKVQTRNVYGRIFAYPMCDRSALLLKLKHVKTPVFTQEDIKTVKALGYVFEEVEISPMS